MNWVKKNIVFVVMGSLILVLLGVRFAIIQSRGGEIPVISEPNQKEFSKEKEEKKSEEYKKELENEKSGLRDKEKTGDEIINMSFAKLDKVDSSTLQKKVTVAKAITPQSFQTTTAPFRPIRTNSPEMANQSMPAQPQSSNKKDELINKYYPPITTTPIKTENTQKTTTSQAQNANDPFGTIKASETAPKDSKSKTTAPTAATLNYFKGEIYGNQEIEDQSSVKFRLTESIKINGTAISRNSILFGKAIVRGNRVILEVNYAKTPEGSYQISLSTFDNDYIEGIYFKAPADKQVEKTTTQAIDDIVSNATVGGKVISTLSKNAASAIGKNGIVKVSLQDGYVVYFNFKTKKE